MKLVKESLYEIKKGSDKSALTNVGLGISALIKKWADSNFDEYEIKDGVIYPSDKFYVPSVKLVKSGRIPDYIKVLAEKPFDMLKEGDLVYRDSSKFHVVEKLYNNDPDIKKKVDRIEGNNSYDNIYVNHENLVIVESIEEDRMPKHSVYAYDLFWGVIGYFIYNGDKL